MPTIQRACKCKHSFQDNQYGNGVRVYNQIISKNNETKSYRCTVCSNEVTVNKSAK